MSEIAVSIICDTYNHEKYVREALESFVTQKTNFEYEVLVHDDASTDGTADIIREYEKKHPNIIKPVYQTENQYSKGVRITSTYQVPRIKGKYVAFCEGDDYWTDPFKLQKQFDAMEMHPEVDMCAHAAQAIYANSGKTAWAMEPRSENAIIPVEDVIMGEGGFVATNSLFYRASLYQDTPKFKQLMSLDYTLQIHGALRGGMLYLSDCMSVYRYMVSGSWTRRMQQSLDSWLKFCARKKEMLLQLDEDTDHKYSSTIQARLLENEFDEKNTLNMCKELLSPKYRLIYRKRPFKMRFKIRLKAMFPFMVDIWFHIKALGQK